MKFTDRIASSLIRFFKDSQVPPDLRNQVMGVSAYQKDLGPGARSLDDPEVEKLRKTVGGQLTPFTTSQTRWFLSEWEGAIKAADVGNLGPAARLVNQMVSDGLIHGLLDVRTGGIIRLPRKFRGPKEIIEDLEKTSGAYATSVFDALIPEPDLVAFIRDYVTLNVAVGELVPCEGRDFPKFVRHNPEQLQYIWAENQWYFLSMVGRIPITPGDGRWVMALGATEQPWRYAPWKALGRAFITKETAINAELNFVNKLANPAIVAKSPLGANDPQRFSFMQGVINWGFNTIFELLPGWELDKIEVSGTGFETYQHLIQQANESIMIALAGQVVTTTGGSAFANVDAHKSISAYLTVQTAEAIALTINQQILPYYLVSRWGMTTVEEIERAAVSVTWDIEPPLDRKTEADALISFGNALKATTEALAPYGVKPDAIAMANQFGIPLIESEPEPVQPQQEQNSRKVNRLLS